MTDAPIQATRTIAGRAWPSGSAAIEHIERELGVPFLQAAERLQTLMLDGLVQARGHLPTLSGKDPGDPEPSLVGASPKPVPIEFWRYAFPERDGSAFNVSSLTRLSWFEVSARELLDALAASLLLDGGHEQACDAPAPRQARLRPRGSGEGDYVKWVKNSQVLPTKVESESWAKANGFAVGQVRKWHAAHVARPVGRPRKT